MMWVNPELLAWHHDVHAHLEISPYGTLEFQWLNVKETGVTSPLHKAFNLLLDGNFSFLSTLDFNGLMQLGHNSRQYFC